jgi:fatty acid desaturase
MYRGPVTSAPVLSRIVKTGPRGLGNQTSEFSALLASVRDAGLLRRSRGFYIAMFAAISVVGIGAWVGIVLLHDTWYTLILAGVLGIVFTQYAFLAHEAAHRQVFTSGRSNEVAGRTLASFFVGISYSWWMTKHSRHHGNPNTTGKDPDIEPDFILFQEKDAAELKGIAAFFARRQGWIFYPVLLLEGINLHRHAFITVFSGAKVDKRATEIILLVARNIVYLTAVFTIMPVGMGFAFIGVQLGVFGLYMGASFAPNHIGMPILAPEDRVDFLRRQVLTSRNIKGGFFMDVFMGGLNYQVEHHLFPSMPRTRLRRANAFVKDYCEAREIEYTETGLGQAHAIVVRYLNKVGLAAGTAAFECAPAAQYGR